MSQQLEPSSGKKSSKYLVLQVRFLLNRYHGSEWPPSPRKLFLAFVSALQSSEQRISKESGEEALEFLERLQAPAIHAPTHKGCGYTIYVPNNDYDLISKYYSKGKESNIDPRKLTTGKSMTPYIVNTIQYVWDIRNGGDHRCVDTLCRLAREIPVLGLGIDTVAVCGIVTDKIPYIKDAEHYNTNENSTDTRIQVPTPGLLKDAKRHHSEFTRRLDGKTFTKPAPITKYREEGYVKDKPVARCFSFKITYAQNESYFVQGGSVPDMIKEVKRVMQIEDSSSIKTVVLPSIGGRHADGQIRRIGIVIAPDKDYETVITRRLGAQIIDVNGQECRLEPLPSDDGVLRTYLSPSRLWRAVTPVDLPIPRNATRKDTTKIILDSLADENIREHVTFVNFRKEPYWSGLPMMPNTDMSLYVELEFKTKVTGPFAIGQNQDLGLGLFAPSQVPSTAYFTVLGTRPPVEKTVMVSELMRRSIMSKIGNNLGHNAIPEYISGHDHAGKPLRDNHIQAFWLPVDSDHDGFIDHIAVYVQGGFERSIQNTFYGMNELNDGRGLSFNVFFNGFYTKNDLEKKCNLFGKHKNWNSLTPYFMPWHTKKNLGRDQQIIKECKKHGFPSPIIGDHDTSIQEQQVFASRFHITHNKLKPINPTGHAVKLSFKDPIRGPVSLGYCSHFGLGMFVPDNM